MSDDKWISIARAGVPPETGPGVFFEVEYSDLPGVGTWCLPSHQIEWARVSRYRRRTVVRGVSPTPHVRPSAADSGASSYGQPVGEEAMNDDDGWVLRAPGDVAPVIAHCYTVEVEYDYGKRRIYFRHDGIDWTNVKRYRCIPMTYAPETKIAGPAPALGEFSRPLTDRVKPGAGVGDPSSTAKGSGARFNEGKVPLDLIPGQILARYGRLPGDGAFGPRQALYHFGQFQMRVPGASAECLLNALAALDADGGLIEDIARVFDYGRQKYAEWNWAKGMAWSIPIGSALRHLVFGLLRDEKNDPESELPHRGHIGCNLVMLLWYEEFYPEGDDRPRLEL